MSWSQVKPGHFQRAIGENELFLKLLGDSGHATGHEHWTINADASFDGLDATPIETLLKRMENAWKTLRFEHPSIAAVPVGQTFQYDVPDAQALQAWSNATFIVQRAQTLADVAATLPATPYAVLHVFPESKEVLLHSSHWRTDGIGILHLLNAFFNLAGSDTLLDAAGLPWGSETSKLAPSIEEAATIPLDPDDKICAEADKWTKTFHDTSGAVGISYDAGSQALPGGTRSTRSSFSEQATGKIIRACKSRHFSVTSAVHAALALTNWSFAPSHDKHKHYSSTIRLGLRPYLPEPYCTPAYASGLYTSGYMHSLMPGSSFQELAMDIHELYRRGLDRGFLQAHRQYALNLQDLIRSAPVDSSPPSSVDISSVGLLDDVVTHIHGNLEIVKISVGVELLTRQMTCFVWTFRGELSMNLVWNEAFYDSRTPARFLDKLMETLSEELNIQR